MAARKVEYIIGLRDRFSKKMGNIQARTQSLNTQLGGLRSTIGLLFTGFIAQKIIGDIIRVGSNFEQLQISFETMLGSVEKANVLIEEITKFAIRTPFELKDVAKGAKSLLAYGIETEKIIPTLKILGDVAAGLSVPIERLILNFGQVKTQSRLTGREIRDFAIAGVPLLSELAKVMGKTTTEVTKLVSAGEVGFPIVEQAFKNMSGEGGKFFNLMIKQTASTSGQISNLRDFIGLLQRDLFNRFKPAIDSVVVSIQRWTAFLRDNIDTVVNIITIMGKFIKLLAIYKVLQLSVNLVIGASIVVNRLYRLSLVLLNRGLLSSIRLMKGFKIALARTGIGIALVVLSGLILKFSGLEKAILKTNAATNKFIEQQEKIRTLKEEIKSTKELFTVRKTLSQQGLIDLKERLSTQIKGVTELEERAIATFRAEKQGEKLRELKARFRNASDLERNVLVSQIRLEEERLLELIKKRTGGLLGNRKELEKQLKIVKGLIQPIPGVTPKIAVEQVGITKIVSAAPKIFNINIEKLVETINNNVTNVKEGMNESKKIITEALLSALNDTQAIVR